MTQSFNVPDKISMDDLHSHLEHAVQEDEVTKSSSIAEEAEYWVKTSCQSSDKPVLLHKLMAVDIIRHLFHYHQSIAESIQNEAESDELAIANSWLQDAGKFQAILNILMTIECDPDDPAFTAVNR